MSKLDKFITARNIGKKATLGRLSLSYDVSESFERFNSDFLYEIGFEFKTKMTAPENPDAFQHIIDVATRQMNNEIYGDVHRGLIDLYGLLYEEMYRDKGSPVIKKIDELLDFTK